jgi:hypothetical protein
MTTIDYPITYRIVSESIWFTIERPKVYYRKSDLLKAIAGLKMRDNAIYRVHIYKGEELIGRVII